MHSIPGVVDIHRFGSGAPDLVIEIPHGATMTTDFTSLEAQLTSPLPAGLIDFFHVNTDAGAPELGMAIAERHGNAVVLRCRIPRTFIDCNRRIQLASPSTALTGFAVATPTPTIQTTRMVTTRMVRGLTPSPSSSFVIRAEGGETDRVVM